MIKAGSRSAAFVYTALVEAITDLVTVTVSGNEAAWYPTGEQLTGDYTRNVVYSMFSSIYLRSLCLLPSVSMDNANDLQDLSPS